MKQSKMKRSRRKHGIPSTTCPRASCMNNEFLSKCRPISHGMLHSFGVGFAIKVMTPDLMMAAETPQNNLNRIEPYCIYYCTVLYVQQQLGLPNEDHLPQPQLVSNLIDCELVRFHYLEIALFGTVGRVRNPNKSLYLNFCDVPYVHLLCNITNLRNENSTKE